MSPRRTAYVLGLALVLTPPAPAVAQSDPGTDDSPEAVACALFRHLEADRWDAAAGLFDERILEAWRDSAIRRWVEWTSMRTPSVEEYVASNPGMPREVAAWELERARTRPRTIARRSIAVDSIEELRALASRESVARALEAYDPAYQRAVTLEDPARSRSREPADARVRAHTRRIVGTVERGDRTFVAYRVLGGPMSPDPRHGPPNLLTLVRTERGWRALPSGDDGLLDEGYGYAIVSDAGGGEPDASAGDESTRADCGLPIVPDSAPDAERYARRYLEHVDRQEWDEVAAYFAGDALEEWLAAELDAMSRDPADVPTVEQLLEHDPEKPRAVVEWELERMRSSRPSETISFRFAGVETIEDLRALTPREAAARALRAAEERAGRRGNGVALAGETEILGIVPEDGYAHALYRTRRTGVHEGHWIEMVPIRPRILILERTDPGWAVRPSGHDLLGGP